MKTEFNVIQGLRTAGGTHCADNMLSPQFVTSPLWSWVLVVFRCTKYPLVSALSLPLIESSLCAKTHALTLMHKVYLTLVDYAEEHVVRVWLVSRGLKNDVTSCLPDKLCVWPSSQTQTMTPLWSLCFWKVCCPVMSSGRLKLALTAL